jgi:thiamine-monophosphate kinase
LGVIVTGSGRGAEFELIERIRLRVASRADVLLGIGDDAALLRLPEGHDLVVSTDTLNAGVHFPHDTVPSAIGWKALAVNLSDLAAMGARPAWCTLSLSLPHADVAWLESFIDGFLRLATQHEVALVGGDTTRGPLSVCVTAHGLVERGRGLRRDAARIGDDIWVTGTLGDAAAALAQLQAGGVADPALRARLDRPEPRVAFGRALAQCAHACIDVSDGLLQDLGHVCRASGVGAEVDVDRLPASPALVARSSGDTLRGEQACGGDDYELCFSAPARARESIAGIAAAQQEAATRIGRIVETPGVVAVRADGSTWAPPRSGYAHFA